MPRKPAATKQASKTLRKRRSRRKPESLANLPKTARRAHVVRCSICCHPVRECIEQDFVHWVSPQTIAEQYRIPVRTVYRHAHAMNLFAVRDRKVRFALGNIIERVDTTAMSANCILRAIQAFTKVNDEGRWVEPPKRLIISNASGALAVAESGTAVATSVAVAIGAPATQLETQFTPAPELLPAGASNPPLPASNR